MPKKTKEDLERENERLRSALESASEEIDDALYDPDDGEGNEEDDDLE